ncbi:MAG: hypothetical protein IT201_11605 [Thermoleophilia bacterium]|nr:hypothetical protein [Thermoleophilia bacterium]
MSDSRPGARDPAADEQEIELARHWWAIVARWWLVVAAVALGMVVGLLVSLGGGAVYQARATIYLGQPLSPGGSSQVQGLQTNPSTVNQIIRSRAVVASVADRVGVPADRLRSGVSSKPVSGSVARLGQTPLVEVVVRGPWRRQSADAANLLADTVVERISGYADTKIEQFSALLESIDLQVEQAEASVAGYRSALQSEASLSATDRLVLVGLLDGAEERRGQLVQLRTQTQLSLTLASDVERGQVVTRAAATKVDARSPRTSIIVGAVIGLVAGIALALLWEPVQRRVRRKAQA